MKTGLYIDPPSQVVPEGSVSADIMATNVADLGSYSITINWNESVLQFASIGNGPLLGSSGLTVVCPPPTVTSNSATLSCITIGVLNGAAGDGRLATINFTTVAEGKSLLTLAPVSLLSTSSLDLDLAVTDGQVDVVDPTPTPGPSVSTAFCDDNAPVTSASGDNDGFEINPDDACEDDGQFAQDASTGTNNTSTCSDAGKDRHVFSDFDIQDVSGGDTIDGIELRLDAKGSTSAYLCAELSWDDGTAWSPAKFTFSLSASETTFWLGSPTDTWGHTWSGGDLSNGNFSVRLTSVSNIPNADVYVDFVEVHVYYTP